MLQRLKRKRGGQPGNKNAVGNQNALKHGKYSPRIKAERLAERRAREAEERARFEIWVAPIEARCRLQHARIIEEPKREREAARIKELQPAVSNRAIAKTLGTDEKTIRNDAAEKSALAIKKLNQINEAEVPTAENSALSGSAAARLVEREAAEAAEDVRIAHLTLVDSPRQRRF
jgi:hypothetical protein